MKTGLGLGRMLVPAVLATALFVFGGLTAQAQTNGGKIKILYPERDMIIVDPEPMIAVELPEVTPPVDITTVQVFVNDADVSSLAEVTADYVIYETRAPFSDGRQTVRITVRNVEGARVDQVNWSFTVRTDGVAPTPVAPGVRDEPVGKTYGSLQATMLIGRANLLDPTSGSDTLIPLDHGTHFEYSLNFTNQSAGRTVNVWLDRFVEKNYQATAHDKFRVTYSRDDEIIVVGDEWTNYSRLTLSGIELRGLKYQLTRNDNKEKYYLYAGRTKEGRSDSRYRQHAFGFRGEFMPNDRHAMAYSVLRAHDVGDSIDISPGVTVAGPISNTIIALQNTHKFSKALSLESELAASWYDEDVNTSPGEVTNKAYRFVGRFDYSLFQLEGRYRRIDTFFFPISNSTAQNDKEGTFFRLDVTPSRFFRVMMSQERYDDNIKGLEHRNTYDTINSLINITWRPRRNMLSYNYNKYEKSLAVAPSVVDPVSGSFSAASELNSVTQTWMGMVVLPPTTVTTATTLMATYTDTQMRGSTYAWTGPGVAAPAAYNVGGNYASVTLSTQYKAVLNLAFRFTESYSDTVSGITTVAAHSKEHNASFQYTFKPFKFLMRGALTHSISDAYTRTGAIPTVTDRLRQKYDLFFDYYLDSQRKFTMGVEYTDYNDRSSTTGGTQDFTESVWTATYNWQF